MAGLINGIRKILMNKNTITIIAVIAGVILLWFFYNMTLENAINLRFVLCALLLYYIRIISSK